MEQVMKDVDERVEQFLARRAGRQAQGYAEFTTQLKVLNLEIKIENEADLKGLRELRPVETASPISSSKSDPPVIPAQMSMMSWNIDGLDLSDVGSRTLAIVDLIEKELPDVIFLQEVRVFTFNYIVSRLSSSFWVVKQETKSRYFTATLLKKATVKYESHKTILFKNTKQGRSLLFTKASVGSAKFCFLNNHLESCLGKENCQIRRAQLQKCLQIASAQPADYNVVIGGDLNIRDWEMPKINVPKNICDLWKQMGSEAATEFTWDMSKNKNIEAKMSILKNNGRKVRNRFDRFLFRASSAPETLRPTYFGLTGTQKLDLPLESSPQVVVFPSDHWAIVAKFALLPGAQKPLPKNSPKNGSNSRSISENYDDLEVNEDEEERRGSGSGSKIGKKPPSRSRPVIQKFVKENWDDESDPDPDPDPKEQENEEIEEDHHHDDDDEEDYKV